MTTLNDEFQEEIGVFSQHNEEVLGEDTVPETQLMETQLMEPVFNC